MDISLLGVVVVFVVVVIYRLRIEFQLDHSISFTDCTFDILPVLPPDTIFLYWKC